MRSDSLVIFFPDESLIQPTFVLPTRHIKQNIQELCPGFLDLGAEYKYEQATISSISFSLSEFFSHGHAHNSILLSQIAVQWPCFEVERSESSRGKELRGGRGKENENGREVEVGPDTTRASWQVLAALALRLIDQM